MPWSASRQRSGTSAASGQPPGPKVESWSAFRCGGPVGGEHRVRGAVDGPRPCRPGPRIPPVRRSAALKGYPAQGDTDRAMLNHDTTNSATADPTPATVALSRAQPRTRPTSPSPVIAAANACRRRMPQPTQPEEVHPHHDRDRRHAEVRPVEGRIQHPDPGQEGNDLGQHDPPVATAEPTPGRPSGGTGGPHPADGRPGEQHARENADDPDHQGEQIAEHPGIQDDERHPGDRPDQPAQQLGAAAGGGRQRGRHSRSLPGRPRPPRHQARSGMLGG